LRRGDIVTVALPGDYGKPRPAVVIQSDSLSSTDSILVCLVTTDRHDLPVYRLPVEPSKANSLRDPSDIMADKIMAVVRNKVGRVIGSLEPERLAELTTMVTAMVGAGDAE
jgi:mRNA interferase MazF